MSTTQQIAQTAADAFERYMAFLGDDRLTQGEWHAMADDGRQFACALGVLGDAIRDPADCPAQIMPGWLAHMVPWLFDNQRYEDATDWGARFYAELKRIDGQVPFTVVYDWNANVVGPLAIEVAEMYERDTAPHEAVRDLHARALTGDIAPRDEWFAKLRPAYADADACVNGYSSFYASADADAYAKANADACAYAYAYAKANVYANACANVYANACANAREAVFKRLADGMVDCLARVPGGPSK